MFKKILCLGLGFIILGSAISASKAATVSGKVNHPKIAYQKDCVVYLKQVNGNFTPGTAQIDQRNLTFIPKILPIMAGTTVDFLNNDSVSHNINYNSPGDSGNFGNFPPGQKTSRKFEKIDKESLNPNLLSNNTYDILCSLHSEMWAGIVVLQNPYFAVTDVEGNYKIENAPEGNFTICVWTPYGSRSVKNIEQIITIGSSEIVVDFNITRKR